MTLAPSVVATTGAVVPKVWSENPEMTPKVSAKFGMVKRFASSSAAGYAEVHLRRTMSLFPSALQISTASWISSMVAIPVEMIIGRPLEAV